MLNRPAHHAAFTLIETIATMTIIAVLMVVISPIVLAGVNGYAAAATRAEIATAASAALDRIAAEVRNIPPQPTSPVRPWITGLTPTSLTWGPGTSLSLSGTDLRLTPAGAAPATLLTNVQSLQILAFDQNNSALAPSLTGSQCDQIQRIQFTLSIARGGAVETLRTRIYPRCLSAGASP